VDNSSQLRQARRECEVIENAHEFTDDRRTTSGPPDLDHVDAAVAAHGFHAQSTLDRYRFARALSDLPLACRR
jgi:hypothetical protein